MDTYRNKFLQMFDEVKNNDTIMIRDIREDILETKENIKMKGLDRIAKRFGNPELKEYFLPFYDISKQAALHWICEEHKLAGEFHFQGILSMLSPDDSNYYYEEFTEDKNMFIRNLGTIDEHPSGGTGHSFHFYLKDKVIPPPIWINEVGRYSPMIIDYKEYVDYTLLTKGFSRWQYLFCDLDRGDLKDSPRLENLYIYLERSIEGLKKLFSGHDYNILDERLEVVRKSVC